MSIPGASTPKPKTVMRGNTSVRNGRYIRRCVAENTEIMNTHVTKMMKFESINDGITEYHKSIECPCTRTGANVDTNQKVHVIGVTGSVVIDNVRTFGLVSIVHVGNVTHRYNCVLCNVEKNIKTKYILKQCLLCRLLCFLC